jgi:hypothetical protein
MMHIVRTGHKGGKVVSLWADKKHKQYLKFWTAQLLEFALPPVLQKYQKEKGEEEKMFWTGDISTPKYRASQKTSIS